MSGIMHYFSTRDRGREPRTFSDTILAGTGLYGGLFMPERLPKLDLPNLRYRPYYERAAVICSMFGPEVGYSEWLKLTKQTYTKENFGTDEITPVRWLEPGLALLDLSQGKSRAFKDVAMQLLARLMDHRLQQLQERTSVIVATSGDTGGAAVEAFAGRQRADLFVLYPHGRVSDVQRLMMTTSGADNIHALAIEGVFDDCQRMVKDCFNDHAFSKRVKLSGVNSINWARILAQVVYWVSGYLNATDNNRERITIVIPSGNFGNALAACIAQEMGLPIDIIIATNENYVLHEFFSLTCGVYRPRKRDEVVATSSPSMDIAEASNFERFLHLRAEGDGGLIRKMFNDLERNGELDARCLAPDGDFGIRSGMANERDMAEAMRTIYKLESRTIIDPHTAVAMSVGLQYRKPGVKMLVAETAKPEKFPAAVKRALGGEPPMPESVVRLFGRKERIIPLYRDAALVKKYILEMAA